MAGRLEQMQIGGQLVWVEVDELAVSSTPAQTAPSGDGKTSKTSAALTAAPIDGLTKVDLVKTLSALVGPVHDALAASSPKEVSLEISLGLKGEVGFFVAKSEGNAALKITAKWAFDNKAKTSA